MSRFLRTLQLVIDAPALPGVQELPITHLILGSRYSEPAALRAISRHNRAMASLLSELKRRNVHRVAAAYALVAWILIEAGSVLLPTFGAPEWFFKVYVVLVMGGFVVSIIIAWVFEITPDGVKLEKDLDRSTYDAPSRGGLNFVLIGLLVVALAVSISFNLAGLHDDGTIAKSSDEKSSVAVLPFENRSADPENGFFADGIHDDLLTRLAGIDALHVISRTSVNEYRDTSKRISVIGEELGVTAVVEGAVQRSGDQVRVTVRLIDVAQDEQLWEQTYDRDASMQSVFELQTEISSNITSSLSAALTPEERQRLASIPTENVEAYELYVGGKIDLGRRRFQTLISARQKFEQAIELDPDYAQAYAAFAETVAVLYANHQAISLFEASEIALAAVERALELDPNNAEAYAVRGLVVSMKWAQTRVGTGNILAADDFRKALQLNSNLAYAYVWFSSLRENEDDIEGAIELLAVALEKDPRNRTTFVNLAGLFALQGRIDACTDLLLKAMQFFPNWETPLGFLSIHLQKLGRLDEAVAWSVEHARMSDDPLAGSNAIGIYRLFGDVDAIGAFIATIPTDHPVTPIAVAFEKFVMDDYRGTLDTLDIVEDIVLGANVIVMPLLVRAAILLEDYERARELILRSNPRIAADSYNNVDRFDLSAVVVLAFVEQKLGNAESARRLLDQALTTTDSLPRVGFAGHGIQDVQILTLQGKIPSALDALRDAIDVGFVSEIGFDFWLIDQDPLLAPLRAEARYIEMRQEMRGLVEAMHQNVIAAKAANDWGELRSRAASGLSASAR